MMITLNGKTMTKSDIYGAKIVLPLPVNSSHALGVLPARAIGALEETSLIALVDYLADLQGRATDSITQGFCERFGISKLAALPACDYDEAVKYLVDQLPEESMPAEG
jgi:hypothetical protein